MTLLRWIVLVALVAAISFKIVFPTYHYRYRMTVEIEANGQVHTGTGVIGVSAVNQTALEGLLASFDMNYWGQAPVVDLGKDGVIVAILRPTAAELPASASLPRQHSDVRLLRIGMGRAPQRRRPKLSESPQSDRTANAGA